MKKKLLVLFAVLLLLTVFASCKKVSKVDADIDLSGYWNDDDIRVVCNTLIEDCLANPEVDRAIKAKAGPKVIVGNFRNESSEHLDMSVIPAIMKEVILKNGKLDVAVQENGNEADFMLTGSLKTVFEKDGKKDFRTYIVSAEMADTKTAEYVWMGSNRQIKKAIVRQKTTL